MAGIAGHSVRVVRRDNLREILGLGSTGRMAAGAENGGVRQNRLHRGRVVRRGVFFLCAMAGFAVHVRMLALAFDVHYIGVARLAGLVAGKLYRACGNLADSSGAIMAILPETLGNHKVAHHQEY